MEEVVNLFAARVVKRTPVGNPALWNYPAPSNYNPGTLKSSWEIDWDRRAGKIKSAEVHNDQPYAIRVENGWSTQAPYGMMRITFRELDIITRKAIQKKGK
jgi:hypothetical protein